MADNWAAGVNGDEDEDEALRVAIALSLGEDPGERPALGRGDGFGSGTEARDGVIDLTQEDDDAEEGAGDRDGAVVVDGRGDGRSRSAREPASAAPAGRNQPTSVSATESGPGSVFSALGLDRKRMEEERLARLNKRKVSDVDDLQSPGRATQRPRIASASPGSSTGYSLGTGKPAAPKAAASGKVLYENLPYSRPPPVVVTPPSFPSPSQRQERATGPTVMPRLSSASPLSRPSPDSLPFPRGVVKKTWAYGQPRNGDDIKIEEVLQKQQLQLAVLSSYQWDEQWLLSKIDLTRTKLILVAFAADEDQQEQMRANVPSNRIRFCFPPMQGSIGSMHSKLMLLKYERYMRIVIPTGNLMSFDWGETGTMENMVFLIDLPKIQHAGERDAQKLTPFAEELFYFLEAQGLDDRLVASLRNYDFSETVRYQFVHTIAGTHGAEDAWKRTGYCGLGRAVEALGLSSSSPLELDFVAASLGAINYSLLTALYYACQGDSGLKEYKLRTSVGKGKQNALDEAVSTVKAQTRIFFPSKETVRQSKGGTDGAGTICFQPKWWQASTFPRELLRDCKSVRPGLLMHSKIIFVRPHDTSSSSNSAACRSFAYVGSANLSESAWGKLVRDRASGKPKLTCRNWECGVLVPAGGDDLVPSQQGGRAADPGDGLRAVFQGRVPVPMEWPGRELVGAGGASAPDGVNAAARTPWFYTER